MTATADDLWVTASELLRSQVSDGVWQSTFAQVAPIELSADTFTLAMPNGIIRDRLDGRYRPLVEDAVAEAAGFTLTIEFELVVPTLFDGVDGSIDLTADNGNDLQLDGRTIGHADHSIGGTQPAALGVSTPNLNDSLTRTPDRIPSQPPGSLPGQLPDRIGGPAHGQPSHHLGPAPQTAPIDLELAHRYTFKNFVTGPSNLRAGGTIIEPIADPDPEIRQRYAAAAASAATLAG